jgi:negative regulator of sigma E activity
MSQLIREQLSALLDSELPIEEEELLFKQLEKSTECRAVLGRYSLMSELIRGPSADPEVLVVSERIRTALIEQAPHSAAAAPKNGWSTSVKGLVGAGIAASVAILALVSLNTINRGPASVSPLGELQTVSDSYVVPKHSNADQMAITPARLTNYLVSHGEYFNAPSRLTIDSHMVSEQSGSLGDSNTEASPDD